MSDVGTGTHASARWNEDRGAQALRATMHALKVYLCNSVFEDKPALHRRVMRMARKLLNVRYCAGDEWGLVDGWKRRLASAGLDEECRVVDARKWERAYKQLIERGNYDPAIAAVGEALEPVKAQPETDATGNNQDRAEHKKSDISHTNFTVKVGKRISFGNA